MSRNNSRILLLCFLLALSIRLIYVFWWNTGLVWPDEKRFWKEILSLIQEKRFAWGNIMAHDMPLTALLLAPFASVFGLIGAKIMLIIISSATLFPVALLANTFYQDRNSILFAGLSCAVYPYFIFYSGLILSETLFMFLLALFFLKLYQTRKTQDAFLLGLTGALCHLTRPTLIYFFPVAGIYYFYACGKKWQPVFVAAITLFILLLPWGLRNYFVLGEFNFATTGSGQVLWEGNNPWNKDGGVSEESWKYLDNMPEGLGEIEADSWKKEQAILFIKKEPQRFLSLALKKFIRFWHLWPNAEPYNTGWYKILALLSFTPILLFALLSLVICRDAFSRTGILWLFIGYYTLIHMITIGSVRYRLPLEPLLIALASAAAGRIASHLQKK